MRTLTSSSPSSSPNCSGECRRAISVHLHLWARNKNHRRPRSRLSCMPVIAQHPEPHKDIRHKGWSPHTQYTHPRTHSEFAGPARPAPRPPHQQRHDQHKTDGRENDHFHDFHVEQQSSSAQDRGAQICRSCSRGCTPAQGAPAAAGASIRTSQARFKEGRKKTFQPDFASEGECKDRVALHPSQSAPTTVAVSGDAVRARATSSARGRRARGVNGGWAGEAGMAWHGDADGGCGEAHGVSARGEAIVGSETSSLREPRAARAQARTIGASVALAFHL